MKISYDNIIKENRDFLQFVILSSISKSNKKIDKILK